MSRKIRLERKLRERRERIRREKHERRSLAFPLRELVPDDEVYFEEPDSSAGPTEPGLRLPSAFVMERSLRDLRRTMESHNFSCVKEANSCLGALSAGELKSMRAERLRKDPVEMAQELAYQAMEAQSPASAESLARLALTLDPDCVDALVELARLVAQSRQELIALLEKAVETGERVLGKEFFEENSGHFWNMIETRPYMRARESLAFSLLGGGHIEEAIGHLEAMLELNPNDNQGNRDTLLGRYLLTGRLQAADRLLAQYDSDYSAIFKWGRVLERYLSGDCQGASDALAEAREQNRHVEAYLTGRKSLPRRLPEYYSPGDEGEAVHCIASLGEAWSQHFGAVRWLAGDRAASMTAG